MLATSKDSALLSYGGPGGAAALASLSVPSDRISVYSVLPGDTLSEIATMFGVSMNTILWANDLKSAKDVHPGDILTILPVSGIERVIKKGDTLKSLAKKYGADASDIAFYNGLDPSETLDIGTTIIIPGGELQTSAKAPSAKSGSRIPAELYRGGGLSLSGFFSNPVPGAILTQDIHGRNGVDLGAAFGTPVYAAASGIVIIARNSGWNGGYGKYVVITHDNGTQTLYSHMQNVIVSYGQSVLQGQVIGYIGSTGRSTGPHLHFEVRGAANPFGR